MSTEESSALEAEQPPSSTRLENGKWIAIGGFTAVLTALGTIIASNSVYSMLEEQTKVHGAGIPYATAVAIFGAAMTILLGIAAFMSGTRWDTPKFCKFTRITLWIGIVAAWICSIWFIIVANLFNQFGVFGLLFASLGGAFGIKVTRLIENSVWPIRTLRPR